MPENSHTTEWAAPGAAGEDALQPLREVGSGKKSRYWDFREIQAALGEARRLGIAPELLFARRGRRRLPGAAG